MKPMLKAELQIPKMELSFEEDDDVSEEIKHERALLKMLQNLRKNNMQITFLNLHAMYSFLFGRSTLF